MGSLAGFVSRTTPPNEQSEAWHLVGSHGCSAGWDRGSERAASMAKLIMSAKLNDIDAQFCLAEVLVNIIETPISRLDQWLP